MISFRENKILVLIILLFSTGVIFAQEKSNRYFIEDDRSYERIPFVFSGNQIIIKLKLNDSKPLNFILDSGVKTPIVIDVPEWDTLKVGEYKRIKIKGLGEGEASDALIAYKNKINIGRYIVNNNQTVLVLLEDLFYLSNRLGLKIHGIIGFDIFRDFIVEINYDKRYLKLYKPSEYKYSRSKRWVSVPLTFNKSKSYVNLDVELENGNLVPVKLLVDTGGSDALWLFKESHDDIIEPENYINDFLGSGLNGDIYGVRSRVKKLHIDRFILKDVTASYPDSTSVSFVMMHKERNGSIGGGTLSRFKVIIDYTNKKISFRKGSRYRKSFDYNMSGIEIYMPYPGLPVYEVHSVRENSPAYEAGVKVGDVITTINNLKVSSLSFPEIMNKFLEREGKKIKLTLSRNGEKVKVSFRLKKEI